MALALATLLTVLDSIAKGVALFEAAVGTGSEADTLSKGAANNVTTLQSVADSQVQADLMTAFRARAEAMKSASLDRVLGGAAIQRVLSKHYGESAAGLNQYLKTNDSRVHPNLTDIGFQIDPENVFAPAAVDPVASFAVTGAGAGTFAAGSSIDTTLYGKANMKVKTTSLIGASTITATVTMTKIDGSSESKQVTIPNSTAANTEFNVGTPGTDMYIGCTAIAITGGTNGDAFKVISAVERTIAL